MFSEKKGLQSGQGSRKDQESPSGMTIQMLPDRVSLNGRWDVRLTQVILLTPLRALCLSWSESELEFVKEPPPALCPSCYQVSTYKKNKIKNENTFPPEVNGQDPSGHFLEET